jgi:hypothetical protein
MTKVSQEELELLIEAICDNLVEGMSRKELEAVVWDAFYYDISSLSEEEILEEAESLGLGNIEYQDGAQDDNQNRDYSH